jgi:protein O-mannosyl-transferase
MIKIDHSQPNIQKKQSFYLSVGICLFFVFTISLAYQGVIHHDFTPFDDQLYVTENAKVLAGFTKNNLVHAFDFTRQGDLTYWHPLTTISHIIDYELFQLQPKGHHLTNLFIHIINTILLFLLFASMTRQVWQSALVSALFAFHPINVDTVAWIAERKNLLSTFFWLLTLFAYLFYAKKPGVIRYIFVVSAMVTGLLCKPMLVTLPCVLLLMDLWPLKRIVVYPDLQVRKNINLVIEKLPLFFLSIFWSYISSLSIQRMNEEIPFEQNPLDIRIANAIISYLKYIKKLLWPYDLAIFYPFPKDLPSAWLIIISFIMLCLITVIAFRLIGKKPWLTVGWLWYIGTLVPVIGLMQNGKWPEMADRWAYVPAIGLFIIAAWWIPELFSGWRNKRIVLSFSAAAYIIIILFATYNQAGYWSSDINLFSHALKVTKNNRISQSNLGTAYAKALKYEEAAIHFKESLKFEPNRAGAHNNLGNVLLHLNRFNEAAFHYKKAIQIRPKGEQSEASYFNMGILLKRQKKYEEAIGYFKHAIQLKPDHAFAHLSLASSFAEVGKWDDACKHYSEVIKIDPTIQAAHTNLAAIQKFQTEFYAELDAIKNEIEQTPSDHKLYYKLGRLYEKDKNSTTAMKYYQKALSLQPDFIPALRKLAYYNAQKENYENAIQLFTQLIRIQPEESNLYYNVACLYAKQNKVKESLKWLSASLEKGYDNYELIRTDPDLKNARTSSEFKKVIQQSN